MVQRPNSIKYLLLAASLCALLACNNDKPINANEFWELQYQQHADSIGDFEGLLNQEIFKVQMLQYQKVENSTENIALAELYKSKLNQGEFLSEPVDISRDNTLVVSFAHDLPSRRVSTNKEVNTSPNFDAEHRFNGLNGDELHFFSDYRIYQEVARLLLRHTSGKWNVKAGESTTITKKKSVELEKDISTQIKQLKGLKYVVTFKDILYIPAKLTDDETYYSALLLSDMRLFDLHSKKLIGKAITTIESPSELYAGKVPGSRSGLTQNFVIESRLARNLSYEKVKSAKHFNELSKNLQNQNVTKP